MYTQKIQLDDLQFEKEEYNGSVAYARAKRGLVILTELWAEKWKNSGIVVNAMHPGWANTEAVAQTLPDFYKFTKNILRTPEQGADTIVWLSASKEAANISGKFFLDRQIHTTHIFPWTKSSKQENYKLYEMLEKICN